MLPYYSIGACLLGGVIAVAALSFIWPFAVRIGLPLAAQNDLPFELDVPEGFTVSEHHSYQSGTVALLEPRHEVEDPTALVVIHYPSSDAIRTGEAAVRASDVVLSALFRGRDQAILDADLLRSLSRRKEKPNFALKGNGWVMMVPGDKLGILLDSADKLSALPLAVYKAPYIQRSSTEAGWLIEPEIFEVFIEWEQGGCYEVAIGSKEGELDPELEAAFDSLVEQLQSAPNRSTTREALMDWIQLSLAE